MDNSQESGHLEISLKTMKEKLLELLSRDAAVVKEASINRFDESCEYEFEAFLSHYSHLESLSMEGRCLISDDHLMIIGGKLKKLQRLIIAMDTSITDVGLSCLSGENNLSGDVSCPLLEDLYIERACCITDKGILPITSRLQQLRHLGLWVNELDNNAVQCIAGMANLKSVVLRNQDRFFMRKHEELMQHAGFVLRYHERIDGDSANGFEEYWTRDAQ